MDETNLMLHGKVQFERAILPICVSVIVVLVSNAAAVGDVAQQASANGDMVRFTITGDPRAGFSAFTHVCDEITNKVGGEGLLHVSCGDYYEVGPVTVAADFYDALVGEFGSDVIWWPTVGNHEYDGDMPWLRDFYDTNIKPGCPGIKGGPASSPKTTYSWDYANIHFVNINTHESGCEGVDGDEVAWLENDLAGNDKPVIFIFYHEPMFADGRGGKPDMYGCSQDFWQKCADYGVIATFCADTHTYGHVHNRMGNSITHEFDVGSAGITSHWDGIYRFLDVSVDGNCYVTVDVWSGSASGSFTITDTYVLRAPDCDGDGLLADGDNCPEVYNPNQADSDNDGVGDVCDLCAGEPDVDSDGDGAADCVDGCANDPAKVEEGICGCGVADVDTDGDGAADCLDLCPLDPEKVGEGICGCGAADVDSDGDSTADCVDNCPEVANNQADDDNDGIGNSCDPGVFLDDFDDDCRGDKWMSYGQSPDQCWLGEINERLQLRSLSGVDEVAAAYCSKDWMLDATSNFALKADFHYSHSDAPGRVFVGLTPDWTNPRDTYVDLQAGHNGVFSFFGYEVVSSELVEETDGTPRDHNDGTLYLSYDAAADELYLSHTGYWSDNAWRTVPGLLQGRWASVPVYISIGGGSDHATIRSGDAYLDNFVLDSGIVFEDLVAWWKMDDNADDTVVKDSSSRQSHNGAAQRNTSVLHAEGELDGALAFDGFSDYISASDSSDWDVCGADTDECTIDAWVYLPSASATQAVVSQYQSDSAFWKLFIKKNKAAFVMYDAGFQVDTGYGGPINNETWCRLTFIKKGTIYALYIDGLQVTYLSDSSTRTFSGNLYIGSCGPGDYLGGRIDDLKVYRGNPFNADAQPDNSDIIEFYPAGRDCGQAFYVDAASPNDPGSGTWADPFRRIQPGIDAANDGDVVLVRGGVYTGIGNYGLNFGGKGITVQGENGPVNCVIGCERQGAGIRFLNGEGATSVLEGLTIKQGLSAVGAGIICSASSPTIVNCIIADCAAQYGGGLLNANGSSPTMINCLFTGNYAVQLGGGMFNIAASEPTIVNCTFSNNSAGIVGGAIFNASVSPTIANSILWGNRDSGGMNESAQIFSTDGAANVTFSCIQDENPEDPNIPFGGGANGNIDNSPMFVDAINGDYHLLSCSPAIDAGNDAAARDYATADLDGNPRFAEIVDMGVCEHRYETPEPGCETCVGDYDGDALVSVQDVLALFEMLNISGSPFIVPVLCENACGDINGDGRITPQDLTMLWQRIQQNFEDTGLYSSPCP